MVFIEKAIREIGNPRMPIDWHQLAAERHAPLPTVDSRRRMRICFAVFALLLAVVFARAVQLEATQGAAFRDEANRPVRRQREVPAERGRILARDGTVLAEQRTRPALMVHYGQLGKMPTDQRKELALLCGIGERDWQRRAHRIQRRVERIRQDVSRRRGRPTVVAEQRDYHLMAENLSPAAVAKIERLRQSDVLLGVRVVERSRRYYPAASTAGHVIGHLGPAGKDEQDDATDLRPGDLIGRAGIERRFDALLRGRRGMRIEMTDHGGRVLSSRVERPASAGSDVVLTLDVSLQHAAERLLAEARRRRRFEQPEAPPCGGAIVVMDIRDGGLLALASVPGFDPSTFVQLDRGDAAALLDDPARPLLNRTIQMALPPGSVMKVVSAAAVLAGNPGIADQPFHCQGYLNRPNALRCTVFIRHGHGHGDVTLGDALCQSCNVYFFHHGAQLGAERLVAWAERFGLGRATGVGLPGETAGTLRAENPRLLAVGQGPIAVTPLQVARMIAAVANGGRLVRPRLLRSAAGREIPSESHTIAELTPAMLAAIDEGLRRVVADPLGTAHGTVYTPGLAVAGKTGTAESGGGRPSHAWFAGYLPADEPRWAVVVALEHAGDAATAAGPVVRRLAERIASP